MCWGVFDVSFHLLYVCLGGGWFENCLLCWLAFARSITVQHNDNYDVGGGDGGIIVGGSSPTFKEYSALNLQAIYSLTPKKAVSEWCTTSKWWLVAYRWALYFIKMVKVLTRNHWKDIHESKSGKTAFSYSFPLTLVGREREMLSWSLPSTLLFLIIIVEFLGFVAVL